MLIFRITPPYDNKTEICVILYGLYIRVNKSTKQRLFKILLFLWLRPAIFAMIAIMHALTQEGVKPVSTIKNNNNIIKIKLATFFGIFTLSKI